MAGPKIRKKLKKKDKEYEDINISERVGKGEAGQPAEELWVIEGNEEPFYITPDSEDFKKMAKEPDFVRAYSGGGKVVRYFNEGGGIYGYNRGGGVNKHQGQYDIQVKKIKKGKIL